ncbi:MAG: methyltransferase family protein [Promethearchaeati archaeon]
MVIKKENIKYFKKILDNSLFNLLTVIGWIIFIFFLIPFSPQAKLVGEGMLILNFVGQILIISGFLIFIWLFIKKRGLGAQEMDKLLTKGAYGFSRHPIYLGHMLIFYGLIFEIGALDSLILSPIIILIYIATAKIEEIYSIGKTFKEQYSDYQKKVPIFLKWWIILILCIIFISYFTISISYEFLIIVPYS